MVVCWFVWRGREVAVVIDCEFACIILSRLGYLLKSEFFLVLMFKNDEDFCNGQVG